jgi:hypothetical protein
MVLKSLIDSFDVGRRCRGHLGVARAYTFARFSIALTSDGWADAVANAPNVSAARIATKATVLLSRPAIMTLSCGCPATAIHSGNMAKSSLDRTV